MEIKTLAKPPMQLKASSDGRTIEGYAATFGNIDLGNDVIVEGAFDKSIRERMPRKEIKMLWRHFDPLGMPITIEPDNKGLFVSAKVSKTQLGNDALELIMDDVVNTMSIGFDPVRFEIDQNTQIRKLIEVRLWEFSPVIWPMNPEAVITGVKELGPILGMKGFSRESTLIVCNLADVFEELKVGRALSSRNRTKLEEVMSLLGEVLAAVQSDNTDDEEVAESDEEAIDEGDDEKDDEAASDPTEKCIDRLKGMQKSLIAMRLGLVRN